MGTQVTPARNIIYIEGCQFRNAISEDLLQRMAATSNFISLYQFVQFQFGIAKTDVNSGSPSYAVITTPFLNFGTKESFPTNATIAGIELFSNTGGSGGTTELDIKWATQNSGSFSSIFSTTPKITSAAPSPSQWDTFGNATTPTGCTVPVFSKTVFNKGDTLRCDIISTMTGNPNGMTMNVYYYPST